MRLFTGTAGKICFVTVLAQQNKFLTVFLAKNASCCLITLMFLELSDKLSEKHEDHEDV